jgi:secreted trypsin-like serine protease
MARVVQGETASAWGWPVYIKMPTHFCGGSIISATWILTAAHCVEGINANQITVYAGSKKAASGSQILTVSRVIIHRAYDELDHGVLINDIALLRLSTPLNITDPRVSAICIPSVNSTTLSLGEWPSAGTTV